MGAVTCGQGLCRPLCYSKRLFDAILDWRSVTDLASVSQTASDAGWANRMVMDLPMFDQHLRFVRCVENLSLQQFIRQFAIGILHLAVLPWATLPRTVFPRDASRHEDQLQTACCANSPPLPATLRLAAAMGGAHVCALACNQSPKTRLRGGRVG